MSTLLLIVVFCELENRIKDYKHLDEILSIIRVLGMFFNNSEMKNDLETQAFTKMEHFNEALDRGS